MINLTEVPPIPDEEQWPGAYPEFNAAVNEVRGIEEGGNAPKWPTCVNCKHIIFFYPADKAYIEGHTYSRAGMSEIHITHLCEFCFDKITEEPEDAERDDQGPSDI